MVNSEHHDVGAEWDRRYLEHGWSEKPDVALTELVTGLTPGRAIDLGCGTGRNSLYLARLGWRVTGVDASTVGLKMATDEAAKMNLAFTPVRDDITIFQPKSNFFDLVVIANIHFASDERGEFFQHAAEAVTLGGYLFITGHHVDALGNAGPPDATRLFTEETFSAGFGGFTMERLEKRVTLADSDGSDDIAIVMWARRNANSSSEDAQ